MLCDMLLPGAVAMLLLAVVAEGSVLSLVSDGPFRHASTSMAASTSVALAVSWVAQKVHRVRQIGVPLPWREGAKGEGGSYDNIVRNLLKTCLTTMQMLVLPWQVSIVACSMAWQFAIHFGGFGGGRPAFTPEDHQFARQRGVMTVSDAYWAPVRWFWAGVYGFCDLVAPYIMNNPKNAPLLVPILGLSVWTPAVFFCFLRWHLEAKAAGLGFSFGMAFAYRVLQMGPYFKFFANAAVMIHKEGHANKTKKGLFKGPLSPVLNHICEWWLAFFYGHTPENYRIGHVEVHHGEGNDHGDASSTLYLDRSKPGSFVRYMGDFGEFWMGFAVCEYFAERIRLGTSKDLARDHRNYYLQLSGIVAQYGVLAAFASFVDPLFAIMYFWVPTLETTNYLAAINYTWHTFVDPDDIDNEYVKSITIIDGHYALYGEDFHVEHHLRPGLHFTKSEDTFNSRREEYAKNKATLFKDTMEFELFILIVTGNHDQLAKHFVDLSGSFPTHEDKVRELRRRMSAVPRVGSLGTAMGIAA